MTKFVPIIGEVAPEPRPVVLVKRQGVVNMPADGTRIRATLGESVVVGVVDHTNPVQQVIQIAVTSSALYVALYAYLEDGWAFEVLDDEIVGHDEFTAVDE